VRAVAAMAKGLGMNTTAEDVETQEQLDTVKFEGCTEVQGFLLTLPDQEIQQFFMAARKYTEVAARDAA
jgi:EAL domain-containing protein (putative c-di-GMP-specific phosphodiesterase class I)